MKEAMGTAEKLKAITDLMNVRISYGKFEDRVQEVKQPDTVNQKGEKVIGKLVRQKNPVLIGSAEVSLLEDRDLKYLKALAMIIIDQEIDNGIVEAKQKEISDKKIKNDIALAELMKEPVVEEQSKTIEQ